MQIDIGATLRTERPESLDGELTANWTGLQVRSGGRIGNHKIIVAQRTEAHYIALDQS